MTAYKNEHFVKLTTPKLFYCTFHHEYAYHKAINISLKTYFPFLGDEVKIKMATEPTDIIWENRHYTRTERTVRWMMARFCMVILAFIGFLAIIALLKNKLAI